MRIVYDSVGSDYVYPLTKVDVARVRDHVPSEIWEAIQYIRFGFSGKSTHAGRTFRRGTSTRIRVNFCVKKVGTDLQSPIVCTDGRYLEGVRRCGGRPDLNTGTITWDAASAKRYALYVLLHEIGHVIYAERGLAGSQSARSTAREEDWCDGYSARLIARIIAP